MHVAAWIWVGLALVSASPDSQPAGRIVAFQRGIRIDWGRKQLEIDSTVVLREGLLELFACSPRTREHESVVRVNCRALHIFQGLGLLGLQPGSPPGWDEVANAPIAPTGDPVEALVRYEVGGKTKVVNAWEWMSAGKEGMAAQHWVFAGSFRTEDGRLSADGEGTVLTVVDFADALLALPESHTADNAQLWLAARTEAIPPVGTECVLILRPARTMSERIVLDRAGKLRWRGKAITKAALGKRLGEVVEAGRMLSVELVVKWGVSFQVAERTVAWLREVGVESKRIRVRRIEGARATQPAGGDGGKQ